jgi:hypothetical protein
MDTKWRALLLVVILLLLLVLLAIQWWTTREERARFGARRAALKAFNRDIARYLRLSNLPHRESPTIRGGVLPITKAFDPVLFRRGSFAMQSLRQFNSVSGSQTRSVGKVDPVYYELPEASCPMQHEDVGTVAWLEWGARQVSSYAGVTPGYECTITLTLIDTSVPAIIARREFVGAPPPKEISYEGLPPAVVIGSPPIDAVVSYITELPRHPHRV